MSMPIRYSLSLVAFGPSQQAAAWMEAAVGELGQGAPGLVLDHLAFQLHLGRPGTKADECARAGIAGVDSVMRTCSVSAWLRAVLE